MFKALTHLLIFNLETGLSSFDSVHFFEYFIDSNVGIRDLKNLIKYIITKSTLQAMFINVLRPISKISKAMFITLKMSVCCDLKGIAPKNHKNKTAKDNIVDVKAMILWNRIIVGLEMLIVLFIIPHHFLCL